MGSHLAIMPFTEAVAASTFFGIRRAALDLALFWPFCNVVSRVFSPGKSNEIAWVIVRMVVISVVHMMALWRQLAMLAVVRKPVRGLVDAVDSLAFALAVSRSWFWRKGGISKLLPSIVVHGAPTATKAGCITALKGARKAGLKTLGSSARSCFARGWFYRWVSEFSPAMVMGGAQATAETKASAAFKETGLIVLHYGTGYQILNIPSTANAPV